MEIQMLDAESYAGQRFTARYQTNGYYDISATESGFQIEYKPFETPVIKSFEDVYAGGVLAEDSSKSRRVRRRGDGRKRSKARKTPVKNCDAIVKEKRNN